MNAPALTPVGKAATAAAPDPGIPTSIPSPETEQALAAYIGRFGDDNLGSCAADECVFHLSL